MGIIRYYQQINYNMSHNFIFGATEIELNDAEREALLYLYNGTDMATTTTVRKSCDSIEYQRKALRVFNSLEELGLIQTRIDEMDTDDSARKSPRVAMITSDGKEFMNEHEAELATADVSHDELREEVHRLRRELEEVTEYVDEQRGETESRIDDLEAQKDTASIRAELEQIDDRVSDIADSASRMVEEDDLERAKKDIRGEIDAVQGDLGERINKTQARIGDVESTVDVLEETVEDIDEWTTETDQWIRNTLIPGLKRITPVVEAYERAQESSEPVNDRDGYVGRVLSRD